MLNILPSSVCGLHAPGPLDRVGVNIVVPVFVILSSDRQDSVEAT